MTGATSQTGSNGEKPRSNLYDGWFYSLVIDPQLKGLHGFILKNIPEGSRVLDACCGTGALAFRLAPRCSEVVGVDLSPRMIKYAERRREKLGHENTSFSVGDVTRLDQFGDRTFDFATMIMAVHEMPPEIRLPAIRELLRVAGKVMLVDFRVPMYWNAAGIRNRFMELSGGRRHYTHFRNYMKRKGLPPLLSEARAKILSERFIDKGNKLFYTVENH